MNFDKRVEDYNQYLSNRMQGPILRDKIKAYLRGMGSVLNIAGNIPHQSTQGPTIPPPLRNISPEQIDLVKIASDWKRAENQIAQKSDVTPEEIKIAREVYQSFREQYYLLECQ